MFIPNGQLWAVEVAADVKRLDAEIDALWRVVEILAREVRALRGDAPSEPALAGLLAAAAPERQTELTAEIQRLTSDESPATARQLRDLLGITWDEAHAFRSRWLSFSPAKRAQFIRSILLRKALGAALIPVDEQACVTPGPDPAPRRTD